MHARSSIRRSQHILLVTPQPFYDDRGTPIAVEHTVRALGALGHRVDVLAFPFGKDLSIPRVSTIRSGNPMRLKSVPIGFSWQKCVLDASLLRSVEHRLRRGCYDVVHAVEEAAYIASGLCSRVPYIYDMASSIPAELAHKPLLGSRPVQSVLRQVEQTVIHRASHVLCSMGLGEQVRAQCSSTPVTEWRFPSGLPELDARHVPDVRSELKIGSDDRVVMYTGNFARYQGIDLLLESFEQALSQNNKLLLVCIGASEAERRVAMERLSPQVANRVRIVTRRPRAMIPAYLSVADCLVSLRPISRNLPLKIFEYIASGIPIVATRGPAHEPLLSSERAYLCEPTVQSVASAIVHAVSSPEKSALIAQAARAHATHFKWDRFVDFIDEVYCSVLGGSGSGELARA